MSHYRSMKPGEVLILGTPEPKKWYCEMTFNEQLMEINRKYRN